MTEQNSINDPQDMAGYIRALPDNLDAAWQKGFLFDLPTFPEIRQILICGMGGSAIGGDLLSAYCSEIMPVPVSSWRNYGLPAWAQGEDCLVICSSHSGNTEETLSSFETALTRNCSLIAISTGGALERKAKEAEITHWRFEHDGQPRTAIAWSFGLLLALLSRIGLVSDQDSHIRNAITEMRKQDHLLGPEIDLAHNPARRLAGQLLNRNIVIFGAGQLEVIARRWKTQINELAKAWASFEGIPEMNHNTLAGLLYPESLYEKTTAIFLRAPMDHPRNQKRIEHSKQFFLQAGIAVEEVKASSDDRLSQMFSLLQFGDYASYYLALAYGVDPTPVDILTQLKEALKK